MVTPWSLPVPCLSACYNSRGIKPPGKFSTHTPSGCAMLSWIGPSPRTWIPGRTMKPCCARLQHRVPESCARLMKENGVHPMAEFFQQLDQLRSINQRVALATLVHTEGTSPRKEGAKMWVGEGGQMLGSVTIGGCVDAQVIEHAEDVLMTQTPRLIELPLGDEEAWEIGLSCAGTLEVFI